MEDADDHPTGRVAMEFETKESKEAYKKCIKRCTDEWEFDSNTREVSDSLNEKFDAFCKACHMEIYDNGEAEQREWVKEKYKPIKEY